MNGISPLMGFLRIIFFAVQKKPDKAVKWWHTRLEMWPSVFFRQLGLKFCDSFALSDIKLKVCIEVIPSRDKSCHKIIFLPSLSPKKPGVSCAHGV